MATLPLDTTTAGAQRNDAFRRWRLAGIALLATRFIQGFIYWAVARDASSTPGVILVVASEFS
jgi:hypothetical protein